jgi:MFS family permease
MASRGQAQWHAHNPWHRILPAPQMTPAAPSSAPSTWAPFHHRVFTVVWIATVISNIGAWMSNLASGWLMLSLNPHPLAVSLVQVASSLPMFLFALPAGALVDILDRRRFLIAGEIAISVVAAVLAALVLLHRITPGSLLALTFLMAMGAAMTAPAWQAVVTQLVPRHELSPAITANSAGVNLSRAIGPALGGVLVGMLGIGAPFWIDAVSNLGVIAALIWWHPQKHGAGALPPEALGGALRAGLRHARHNPALRATLFRAAGFFTLASAYWALLPLVVQAQLHGSASLYGALLGALGATAVAGAIVLPRLRKRFAGDTVLTAATLGTALACALYALAAGPWIALAASLIAGPSWIAALSSLNVSAQMSLPEWVRGRGLAIYVTVMFGCLTLGSALWGEIAALVGLPESLLLAAVALLGVIPVTLRWRLQAGAGVDLTPSLHWPEPLPGAGIEPERGPVLVSIEYRIDPREQEPFLAALVAYSEERRRDGAYDWCVFEDPVQPGRFVEIFREDSWLEHLRHHQRVTQADRTLENAVRRFHLQGEPLTTHLVSALTRPRS